MEVKTADMAKERTYKMNTAMQQQTHSFTKLSDAFPSEDCYTIDEVSKKLGLKLARTRQLLRKSIQRRLVQNLSKREGVRVLYPEPMVKQLENAYNTGGLVQRKFARKNNQPVRVVGAELVLSVPVFDEAQKDILLTHFGSESKIVEFLKDKMFEITSPVKKQLEDLDAEYAARKKQLLSGSKG